jgi:hypothetical protein
VANLESNTLLEKLTHINSIKNRLRQVIINIGGGGYITEQSPFAAFPRAISRVHSDIKNTSAILEYTVNGGTLPQEVDETKLTYKDVLPYVDSIQATKYLLVDNLRVKGINANISEPFEDLVNKVLDIEGEGQVIIGERVIYSNTYNVNGHLVEYQVLADDTRLMVEHRIINIGDTNIPGIIWKDIFTESGDTRAHGLPIMIYPGENRSLSYGWGPEYIDAYNRHIEMYAQGVITQVETTDTCETLSDSLPLSSVGYTDLDLNINIKRYYSDMLGTTMYVTNYSGYIPTGELYLERGICCIGISPSTQTYNYLLGNDPESPLSIGMAWHINQTPIGPDEDFFLTTHDEFRWDMSFEEVNELYENYLVSE